MENIKEKSYARVVLSLYPFIISPVVIERPLIFLFVFFFHRS